MSMNELFFDMSRADVHAIGKSASRADVAPESVGR
jgi:hypothetical protein